MAETHAVELGSVQQTLLMPLWGRAVETKKADPLLVDPAAAEIVGNIEYDFSTIARNISPITRLAWIARSLHTDRAIRGFLNRFPDATVVNLGCGLDTTFERVDNGRLRWYDLDLPDVIELRRQFIPESARRGFLTCSVLDDRWLAQVEPREAVFFLASGVLYYFEEGQVRTLLAKLAGAFPGCELFFDACSPLGLRVANERVIKAGGMDESAILKWGLRRPSDLETWGSRITVLSAYPIFRGFRRGLSFKEKWGTFLSDRLGIMSMVHLRLGCASCECAL